MECDLRDSNCDHGDCGGDTMIWDVTRRTSNVTMVTVGEIIRVYTVCD